MKLLLNIFGWITVIYTIFAVIFTLLTTYLFIYIPFFTNYFSIQIGLLMTMLFLGMRFAFYERGRKRTIYVSLCLFFIMGCIFFIFSSVH
ncbi:hypothetical protein SAMN05444401_2660 [Clostridium amylolyticum]|uniref:Uncharacterized protein n=1 Tax=Clostridium amylolyticum TaxID=1121298 RepID=A0A1M6I630_9CLOT|nr:hypothetical protein SAMN05444401_2660 [Clostridium amylolyticum]